MSKFKKRIEATSLFLVLGLMSNVYAKNIKVDNYDADYKVTYETIQLTPNEKMGLVGVSTLFDMNDNWYGGATLYGAVEGERGGFFTVGLDGGFKTELFSNLSLKSGMFLGAGGGGAAPQGGGLMFRPYVETTYLTQSGLSLGLGVSHLKFPNGEIESDQVYLLASVPTTGNFLKGHHFSTLFDDELLNTLNNKVKVSFLVEHYVPSALSTNTDGVSKTQNYDLAGVELDLFQNENLFNFIQLAGAGRGDSAGYMEVFGGVGYQYHVGKLPLYLVAQAGLGAAGGGKVDTGGGVAYRADAGLNVTLSKHLSLEGRTGVIAPFKGDFQAQTYTARLAYSQALDNSILESVNLKKIKPIALTLRLLNKSYLNSDKIFKSSDKNERLDLLGFALDSYLDNNFYLTGQTFWAYDGESGGYAEGVVGGGYKSDTIAKFSLYTEVLAGVGGGGGVNIGGGLFGSLGGGVTYSFRNNLDVFLGGAYVKGRETSFSSTDLTFGLSYAFSLLGR